jgi:hypothetical protein
MLLLAGTMPFADGNQDYRFVDRERLVSWADEALQGCASEALPWTSVLFRPADL